MAGNSYYCYNVQLGARDRIEPCVFINRAPSQAQKERDGGLLIDESFALQLDQGVRLWQKLLNNVNALQADADEKRPASEYRKIVLRLE